MIKLLSLKQVAEAIHKKPSTIRFQRQKGTCTIPFRKVGRKLLCVEHDLDEWILSHSIDIQSPKITKE
jgi:hypothetical protein